MRHFIAKLLRNAGGRKSALQIEEGPLESTTALEDGEATPGGNETTPGYDDANDLPDPAVLDGSSDYRPFLREGVPPELKRLALRRAWMSDPKIASFKGFADYDWNANAPSYGLIGPLDVVVAAASMIGQAQPEKPEGGDVTAKAPLPAPDFVPGTEGQNEQPEPDAAERALKA